MKQQWKRGGVAILVGLILVACGSETGSGRPATDNALNSATTASHGAAPMAGSVEDHGSTTTGDAPFDARFIDSMIEHHRGAIAMAQQALTESERPEIKQLSENVVRTQQDEIDRMTEWRKQWHPDLAATGGMGMAMGDMSVSGDTQTPFDQRFIAAMIAHHQGAIMMAKEAQEQAEHAELKELAGAIISAQEGEVADLEQWRRDWFGQ